MKTLEVRRHSLRKNGGGSQVSQARVLLLCSGSWSLGVVAQALPPPTFQLLFTPIAIFLATSDILILGSNFSVPGHPQALLLANFMIPGLPLRVSLKKQQYCMANHKILPMFLAL